MVSRPTRPYYSWIIPLLCFLLFSTNLFANPSITDLQQIAYNHKNKFEWLDAAKAFQRLRQLDPDHAKWNVEYEYCLKQNEISQRYLSNRFDQLIYLPPEDSLEKMLKLYNNVIQQIETNYVEVISYNRMVQEGFRNVDLALQNPTFIAMAWPNENYRPKPLVIKRYRRFLNDYRNRLNVQSREEAIAVAKTLATGFQSNLTVRPAFIVLEFICASCSSLDAYSVYLSPDRFAIEMALTKSDIAGVGLDLISTDQRIVVRSVMANSPASRAGIQVNEELIAVGGVSVKDMSVEEASLRLLGKLDSSIKLSLIRPYESEPYELTLQRDYVNVPSINNVHMLDPDAGVGYLHIAFFQQSTLQELDAALQLLSEQGMRALVLDLRGNPGGLFDIAIKVADRFLSQGVIVSTKGRNSSPIIYRAREDQDFTAPLIVLIDGNSASSSEIVAGAIKDHQRGILIGQKSYGKGTVQYVFRLVIRRRDGKTIQSGMRLTTSKFYSPLNQPYQDNGISPDIVVDESEIMDDMNMESMSNEFTLQRIQLEKALDTAREIVNKP